MKTMRYILPVLGLLLGLMTACSDDDGNYDYISAEEAGEIKIDTIGVANRQVFYTMEPGQHIEFEPNVTYKYPERLRWRWFVLTLTNYVYRPQQVGNAMVYPPADTIAYTRKLDWVVDLKPGQYFFYVMAEDTVTGMKGFLQPAGQYTVVSQDGVQGGVYLLVERDGNTDIEVLTSSLMLIHGGDAQYPRYYSQMAGHTLPGRPKFIRGTHTGSVSKNGYLVCTDRNLYRLNSVGLQTMDEWNDMFYETPAKFNPQAAFFTNNCDFLINDGKLHVLYTNQSNDRKWSAPIAGDYEAGDFLMFSTKSSWGHVDGSIDADMVIFDRKNRRFRPYFTYGTSISSFHSTTGDVVADANSLPSADPVVILNGGANYTYYIVQEEGTYWLYRFNFYNRVDNGDLSAAGANSKIDLSGCEGLAEAKLFASCTNGSAFYYATGNTVYSFSPTSGAGTSNVVYTCESGEEITCIYASGSVGGGWPTSAATFYIGVWNEGAQDGKVVEFEMDHNYGIPNTMYGPMFGVAENPTVTTGWGKIVSMTHIDAE